MNNFWPVRVLRFVSVFFILSVCLGMYFYPGGNIHNPTQAGYSFTHNFLSDLIRMVMQMEPFWCSCSLVRTENVSVCGIATLSALTDVYGNIIQNRFLIYLARPCFPVRMHFYSKI